MGTVLGREVCRGEEEVSLGKWLMKKMKRNVVGQGVVDEGGEEVGQPVHVRSPTSLSSERDFWIGRMGFEG